MNEPALSTLLRRAVPNHPCPKCGSEMQCAEHGFHEYDIYICHDCGHEEKVKA